MMGSSQAELAAFLPELESVTRRAGDIAMAYFRLGETTTAAVSYKSRPTAGTGTTPSGPRRSTSCAARPAPRARSIDWPVRTSNGGSRKTSPCSFPRPAGSTATASTARRWPTSAAPTERSIGSASALPPHHRVDAPASRSARLRPARTRSDGGRLTRPPSPGTHAD